jgi:hypothetical protein
MQDVLAIFWEVPNEENDLTNHAGEVTNAAFPGAAANQQPGEARAHAAFDYLVVGGIAGDRLQPSATATSDRSQTTTQHKAEPGTGVSSSW